MVRLDAPCRGNTTQTEQRRGREWKTRDAIRSTNGRCPCVGCNGAKRKSSYVAFARDASDAMTRSTFEPTSRIVRPLDVE